MERSRLKQAGLSVITKHKSQRLDWGLNLAEGLLFKNCATDKTVKKNLPRTMKFTSDAPSQTNNKMLEMPTMYFAIIMSCMDTVAYSNVNVPPFKTTCTTAQQ